MKVAFYTGAAKFVSPLTLVDLYGSQKSTGTAVLTEEELDWLQSGVVYLCARPPQKRRPPVSKRQVKCREGQECRLFHVSQWPPRPRAPVPTLAGFPASPDYCAHDGRRSINQSTLCVLVTCFRWFVCFIVLRMRVARRITYCSLATYFNRRRTEMTKTRRNTFDSMQRNPEFENFEEFFGGLHGKLDQQALIIKGIADKKFEPEHREGLPWSRHSRL